MAAYILYPAHLSPQAPGWSNLLPEWSSRGAMSFSSDGFQAIALQTADPSDWCPVWVPINVLTMKSSLSRFGEAQTFFAPRGPLLFVCSQPLPSPPPMGGGRQRCCPHWKKSHSRNSVITRRSSREDKVRKMCAVLCLFYIVSNSESHLVRK